MLCGIWLLSCSAWPQAKQNADQAGNQLQLLCGMCHACWVS
jgi:hypothetical protein